MVTFHDFLHKIFYFHVVLKSCLTNALFSSPYVKQSSSSLKDLLNVNNKDNESIGHIFLFFVLVMMLL